MDRLDAMRAFVTVARLGSFAEAARRLRLSPSAVTRAVAGLEDQFGATLLIRTTRSVRLTERGQAYLDSCQRLLEDLDTAERRVRGENAEPFGELTVAAPVTFGRLHVLLVVAELLGRYPALRVRLALSDRNAHLVEQGIDLAIRIGELEDSSLIAARLGAVGRWLVASPAYLAARGTPASPAALADHDLIAFEGVEASGEWRFSGAAPVRVEPRLLVNSVDASIAAAEAGVGIGRVLSYQAAEAVEQGRLARVLDAFAPPALPVSALYPARRADQANLAVLLEALRRRFAGRSLPT